MGGPGSGPQTYLLPSLMHKAMERVDKRLPELFDMLIQKALDGDREALIYLIDRRMGKPKQATELTIEGSSDMALLLFRKAISEIEERKLLEGGDASEKQESIQKNEGDMLG